MTPTKAELTRVSALTILPSMQLSAAIDRLWPHPDTTLVVGATQEVIL